MKLEGTAGPQKLADGASATAALGGMSELLMTEYHGRYTEISRRGTLFHAVLPAATVVAANVSPLPANGTPLLALYNPLNSQRNLALIRHHVATISGTPGGPLLWNYALNQSPTNTAFAQAIAGNLSLGSGAVGRVLANTALAGSGAMALLKIAASIPAVATAYAPASQEEEAGTIVIPPGAILALAAYAVGTSHLVMASLSWEELPI